MFNLKDISYIFLLLALLAEIVGTIGGFGSSVYFVPVATFYFDFHTVLGLTAVYHVSSNLSKMILFNKGLDKKMILNIGVPSVLFVIVGGFLSRYFNDQYFELVLASFLIAMSLLFLIRKNLIVKATRKNAITGGAVSGFSAGLLGTGGAIRGLTMAAFNMEKSAFIATSAVIDFMIDFSRTFVYYSNGYMRKEDLIYYPILIVIGFIGTWLGKRILNHITQERFKTISLTLILLIGLVTLGKVIFG